MTNLLEFKKIKRTGLLPTFIIGGVLIAAIPILKMILLSNSYQTIEELLMENWQMIAMLNTFLMISGACIVYSLEYANNAIKKIESLPVSESSLFFNKFFLMAILVGMLLIFEMLGIAITAIQEGSIGTALWLELSKHFAFLLVMNLPAILFSLIIASLFENIWTTVGINLTLLFLSMMIYQKNFWLSLIPFALPFQLLQSNSQDSQRIVAAMVELFVLSLVQLLILKFRRDFR